MYDRLESELELVCYCNAIFVKIRSVLNHVMYSWVVHFLNYFISISERDIEPEKAGEEGIAVKLFIYFFM